MIGVAVVGYGYWGPNLVRNLAELPDAELLMVCDLERERLATVSRRFPNVAITDDFDAVLANPAVTAVAIATPVSSHYRLAMSALMSGKHVFIEKPITHTVGEAKRLVDEAARRNLVLAVDHTFIHTGAVKKMREVVEQSLGEVYYYDSVRVNLGIFQRDTSVLWDLAVHDLSIMDFVLPERPVAVSATGMSHVRGAPENIAYLNLLFSSRLIAHIHVNWLAPVKVRRTLIGGSSRMVVYDDLEPSEKIRIYDSGITLSEKGAVDSDDLYQTLIGYRTGDMWAPKLDTREALSVELAQFLDCIQTSATPTSDGRAGLRVVEILEAASLSLAQRGRMIDLEDARQVA
jgi:predicted dehydrogenase